MILITLHTRTSHDKLFLGSYTVASSRMLRQDSIRKDFTLAAGSQRRWKVRRRGFVLAFVGLETLQTRTRASFVRWCDLHSNLMLRQSDNMSWIWNRNWLKMLLLEVDSHGRSLGPENVHLRRSNLVESRFLPFQLVSIAMAEFKVLY